MKIAVIFAVAAALMLSAPASAEMSGEVVKIGVLNDMSGLYADIGGAGSVEAARMAIADFGGTVNGKKIELIVADDQNKPDIGVAVALTGSTMTASTPSSTCRPRRSRSPCRTSARKKKVFLLSGTAGSFSPPTRCSP